MKDIPTTLFTIIFAVVLVAVLVTSGILALWANILLVVALIAFIFGLLKGFFGR